MIMSIIVFLAVLSLLVLVHELGHYWVARRNGVLVEEFGIGYPPRVYGKKIGETIYSVNALPFGGFVRLHGESLDETISQPKRAFLNKSKKTRFLIVVAGVVMNFLLAIVALAIVYTFSGVPVETQDVKILEISEGSPAADADFVVGDVVKDVNGESVVTTAAFIEKVAENKGKEITITVAREDGEIMKVVEANVIPRVEHPEDEGSLGVAISTTEIYYPPVWQRPFIGIYYGFKEALFWTKTIVVGFAMMIQRLFVGEIPREIAGPVGIYALTSQAAQFGVLTLINFIGILSVNLVILNLLPFPALDGGRLMFILIEALIGKKIVPKVEYAFHVTGMIILLSLVVIITIADVRRLIINGGITGFLESFMESAN
jgi:regulator of sigma E protease